MNLKNFVGPLIKLVVSVGPLEVCRSPLFVICLQSKWQDPKTKTISLMDPKELPWTIPIQILKRLDVSPLKKKHAKKTSLKPRYHISIMSGVFRYFPCNPNPSSSQRSQELMGLTYAKHFAESPFAYHGAPSGTTSRLRSWCWKPQIGWWLGHGFFWGNLRMQTWFQWQKPGYKEYEND